MNEFLARFEFTEDPFESTNAENEALLSDYFVPPPYFASVLGDPKAPASHVVFAPRGSGKTAQRRMIEEKSVKEGQFLCITYDSFDQPPGFTLERADLNYHLNQVSRLILLGILFRLEDDPSLAKQLSKYQHDLLKFQVDKFLGGLSVGEFQIAMQSIKSLGDKASDIWNKYGGAVAVAIQALLNKAGLDTGAIPTEFASEIKRDENLSFHFKHLIDIAKALSFESVYVLVDKVDETSLTSIDSKATFSLIASLLSNLPTLEQPGVGFKFFLWDQIAPLYRELGGRPDRVKISELKWTVPELQRMLEQRLKAFSRNKVASLNFMLCADSDLDLDALVAQFCQGSPRDMIRLAKTIVSETTRLATDVECISESNVWSGLRAFSEERAQELCPAFLSDLKKVQKLTFTIGYVSSEVFRVGANAGRAKIQKWESGGVVGKIGTVPNPPNRPMHLYGVTDVRVALTMMSSMEVPLFLSNLVFLCPNCGTLVISDENRCVCIRCANEFSIGGAESLLTTCSR